MPGLRQVWLHMLLFELLFEFLFYRSHPGMGFGRGLCNTLRLPPTRQGWG